MFLSKIQLLWLRKLERENASSVWKALERSHNKKARGTGEPPPLFLPVDCELERR